MAENEQNFRFEGSGFELFRLYLANLFLTVVTFGIYFFWAKVKTQKYFYNHTLFMNGRFDYHVTGKEKFIAFLKGVLILIPAILIILYGLPWLLTRAGLNEIVATIVSVIFLYAVILFLIPAMMYGSMKFKLARSSWNSIHFRYNGRVKELYKIFFKGLLLSIVTLGFYSIWFGVNLKKYHTSHSAIGNSSFDYDGTGKDIFFLILKGMFLTMLSCGLYYPWFLASLIRYDWEHSSLQGSRFRSGVTGGGMFLLMLKTVALTIFTLGIGLAWVAIMQRKYMTDTLAIAGAIDLTQIEARPDRGSSALADGLAEAGDFFDMIGDFFV
jgi:uncharacterized membrane protein YjgN (DUF898 family)